MIGLDTSHCEAFTKLLNDPSHPFHVPGGKIEVAYAGGSPDLEVSYSRVDKITAALRDEHGVEILSTPEEVAEKSDAIFLTAVDGRVHLDLFQRIVKFRKPTFIDKPFAVTTDEAKQMFELAKAYNVPLMSASAIRFSENLQNNLTDKGSGDVIGADCFGPMNIQPKLPGLYWYGIHSIDVLYRIMGKGCKQVTSTTNEDYEYVIGVWEDGRIGTVRGNRKGNKLFGASIHRESETDFIYATKQEKPIYAGLVEDALNLFKTGKASIEPEETIEVIRFIEAANESRETGKSVHL